MGEASSDKTEAKMLPPKMAYEAELADLRGSVDSLLTQIAAVHGTDGYRNMQEIMRINNELYTDYHRLQTESDATIATLTAALEEARGALEAFEWACDGIANDIPNQMAAWNVDNLKEWLKDSAVQDFRHARTALATINAALGRTEG